MGRLVKEIQNQFKIEFDSGKFDEWCVYLETPEIKRYAPLDVHYFTRLQELGKIHGHQKIYDDFVKFYIPTNKEISNSVNLLITELSADYGENKQFAILKKRVKRLGVYQVLMDAQTPTYAANFSKGKKWRELDSIMKPLGI